MPSRAVNGNVALLAPLPRVYRMVRERAEDGGQMAFRLGVQEELDLKEKDVQKQIKDYLNAKGIFSVRQNTGMAVAEYHGKKRAIRYHDLGPGAPDLWALLPGSRAGEFKMLWIECKSMRGQQTMAQMGFEQAVKAQNHLYVVAHSVDDLRDFIC